MKKRILSVLLLLGLLVTAAPALAGEAYVDIPSGAWYETAGRYVIDRGIMTGTGAGFEPEGVVTRGEVVQILYNLAGRPDCEPEEGIFPDADGAWYAGAAHWAFQSELLSGLFYSGDTPAFRGGEPVTRAEAAALIAAYANQNGIGILDTGESARYAPDYLLVPYGYVWGVNYCWRNGLMVGDQNGLLRPGGVLKRCELAQILWRLGKLCAPDPDALRVFAVETGYGGEMWRAVCAAFTEETGIPVELVVDRRIEEILEDRLDRGIVPDVVCLPTGREAGVTEMFIESRQLADLTGVLDRTVPGEEKTAAEKLLPGAAQTALASPYGDGRTYLAPVFYGPCGLFYDQALFAREGWAVPRTWDEMWALGDKAAAEGMYLFTYPTTGYLDQVWYALLYQAGGPEFFARCARYEKGVWDTPEAKRCFDIMAKLARYTHPDTPRQANDWDFQANQQLVLDDRVLFMPNGPWIVGEMADAPRAEGFTWGMTALPGFRPDARYSYAWMDQCWVPEQAAHRDAAGRFIAFLYSDKACARFAQGGALQPVRGLSAGLTGEERLYCASAEEGGLAAGSFAGSFSDLREYWLDPMNSLVEGIIAPERWLELVKDGNDRMRAALE